MGYEYFRRPLRSVVGESTLDSLALDSGLTFPVESLTATAALQTLASTVVASFITQGTSGAGRDFRLPAPVAGRVKFISVHTNTTSPPDVRIVTNTTAQTFFGSSFNQAAVGDSTAVAFKLHSLLLVGVSTSQWAVLFNGSTASWVFTATTGSTGQ